MTIHQIRKYFPHKINDSAFIARNLDPESPGKNTVVECAARHEPLAKDQSKKAAARRFHIRFTSVRKRLCDPDNLSAKWLLDCVRYCGIIEGDEPEKITFQIGQRKTLKGEQEFTEIEITPL